jgi:hypothetical protein
MNPAARSPRELSPQALRLLGCWVERCDPDGLLPRSRIDPLFDLRDIASYLLLLRRTEDGAFLFRVVGTQVVQLSGRDVTGKQVDAELYGESGQRFADLLETCCKTGRAFAYAGTPLIRSELFSAQIVGIPLRCEGETTGSQVLATFTPHGHALPPTGLLHRLMHREVSWMSPAEVRALPGVVF